eukprot:6172804-Pleurochrysis_carterae.AAC.2
MDSQVEPQTLVDIHIFYLTPFSAVYRRDISGGLSYGFLATVDFIPQHFYGPRFLPKPAYEVEGMRADPQ